MELRLLRYFLAVAREENITRAAESLHISQPSLSKQLMELEAEIGKPLLIRGKRKIALTEDGVLLRKRADEILSLVEKTDRELHSDAAQVSGEVAIGGNPTASLLETASALRQAYPGIHFAFYSSDATDVLERLEHGSLDFAVFLEPTDTTKYEYLSLPETSRWGLLMPSECQLSQQDGIHRSDLSTVPLIFHRRPGLQRLISHWAETDIENLNIAATYNVINGSPERFVQSGLGYFLMTEDLLPSRLEDGLCFCPLEPLLEIRYALIWKRYAVFSKAAGMFLDGCREQFGQIIKKSPE